MDKDIYFLEKTFALAKRAQGFTSPNPLVGAVIVKNGVILAEGYHKKAGLPHAEIEALRKASCNVAGATLYVNLEPCCHFGRTPPCVDEIISRKIKRVVIAVKDPNQKVNGKAIAKLKQAGIAVCEVTELQEKAIRLNEVFFKNMCSRKPFVVVKIAQSLDGKIATSEGVSKWITGPAARDYGKSLRDRYDSVLVGINTVRQDNPKLNGLRKIPFKVVIDPTLEIDPHSYLLRHDLSKLIIFSSAKSKHRAKKLPPAAKVFFLKSRRGRFNLAEILNVLYRLGIMSVFVEGGSQTVGRFFDAKLVDKIYFFIAPKIIGGDRSITSVGGDGFRPGNWPRIVGMEIKRISGDICVSGYPCYERN
ncbi:MAG: bifunctional diaminohydroxyphosphoribosylaminopyrimidine deaminase/5-amino-6-(5-phosphoribosylamino)uracil reductase RibD [Candidatus Omnitrophota bacterium]